MYCMFASREGPRHAQECVVDRAAILHIADICHELDGICPRLGPVVQDVVEAGEEGCTVIGFNHSHERALAYSAGLGHIHHLQGVATDNLELHIVNMGIAGSIDRGCIHHDIDGNQHNQPGCYPFNCEELPIRIYHIATSSTASISTGCVTL